MVVLAGWERFELLRWAFLSLSGLVMGGSVACTPVSCASGGELYLHGESFECEDGCNQCKCDNGMIVSTAVGCGSFSDRPVVPAPERCITTYEIDEAGLDPTLQEVIDTLARDSRLIPWMPRVEPLTIDLVPDEATFCDGAERADIPVTATLTFSSGNVALASGNLALLHQTESTRLTSVDLSLMPREPIDGRDLFADSPACFHGDVSIRLTAVPNEGRLNATSAIFSVIDDCN